MFKTCRPDETACTLKERDEVLTVYCKEIWQVERRFATEKTSFGRFDSQKTIVKACIVKACCHKKEHAEGVLQERK